MDGRLRSMTAVYISRPGQMLLLYRVGSRVVAPSYCGVGGHFEPEELSDARACVLREVREEIGLEESDLMNLRMRYAAQRLKNGEIRQNYYFFADLKPGVSVEQTSPEGRLEWVNEEEILSKEMPVTARFVLEHYLRIGRTTNCLYAAAATKDGVVFTELLEF